MPGETASQAKPVLSQVAELISAFSSFSWPLIVAVLLFILRHRLEEVARLAIKRLEGATDIEIGAIKIKGAVVTQHTTVIRDDARNLELVDADDLIFKARGVAYEAARFIEVVHTIRPADPEEYIENLRVFDVSIYIVPHRDLGKMNDIKQVSYYFGHKWGKESEFGSRFVVRNGNQDFAITAQMYGACLCIAEIEFHDGTISKQHRYLDVEMAPIYGIPIGKAR